jgi:predicted CoA-binding protein
LKDWRANLVVRQDAICALAASFKRVAVLGIKTIDKAEQPAYHVPEYLLQQGVRCVLMVPPRHSLPVSAASL